LIAYASACTKCHHSEVFTCARLNSQPMVFYAPAQIVEDTRRHGVEIRPVSVNHSRWDCTLEATAGPRSALRLGRRMAKGLANADGADIVLTHGETPFSSVEEMSRRSHVPVGALEQLAEADAFRAMGLGRRQALWAIRGLAEAKLPLWAAADAKRLPRPEATEAAVALTPIPSKREVVVDYRSLGLSLRAHPVFLLGTELAHRGMIACGDLLIMRDGRRVVAPGALVRQRPGSAKGTMFMTLEDETGIANIVVWPSIFESTAPQSSRPACCRCAAVFKGRARLSMSSPTSSKTCHRFWRVSACRRMSSRCAAAGLTRPSMAAHHPVRGNIHAHPPASRCRREISGRRPSGERPINGA
jgi:error-prone DNA polymerase